MLRRTQGNPCTIAKKHHLWYQLCEIAALGAPREKRGELGRFCVVKLDSETIVSWFKDRAAAEQAYTRLADEPRPGKPARKRDPYQRAVDGYSQIYREHFVGKKAVDE